MIWSLFYSNVFFLSYAVKYIICKLLWVIFYAKHSRICKMVVAKVIVFEVASELILPYVYNPNHDAYMHQWAVSPSSRLFGTKSLWISADLLPFDSPVQNHYSDVIVNTMVSQITSLTVVYSTVYSGADKRKHQSSASLVFVRGIHRWPVNSPHKGPVTRKMSPFDDVIMFIVIRIWTPIYLFSRKCCANCSLKKAPILHRHQCASMTVCVFMTIDATMWYFDRFDASVEAIAQALILYGIYKTWLPINHHESFHTTAQGMFQNRFPLNDQNCVCPSLNVISLITTSFHAYQDNNTVNACAFFNAGL